MSEIVVVVRKDTAETKIGLRLEDRKTDNLPKIVAITPGFAAAQSGNLKKGDVILSINGGTLTGHKNAAQVLKDAVGDISLTIQRSRSSSSIFRRSSKTKSTVAAPAAGISPREVEPAVPAEPESVPVVESVPVEEAPVATAAEKPAEPEVLEAAGFDVDDQQYKAAILMQAASRGNMARKEVKYMAAEKAAVTAPPVKAEEPPAKPVEKKKPPSSGGFLGFGKKKTVAQEPWEDVYEVTLERGEDTFKMVDGQKVAVKASLGMKIVQYSVDSPPLISDIYPDQPAARTGVMRKGDTILTVNGIDMSDPTMGIQALAEASSVVIRGKRGEEEVSAAATKLQAIYRGDKVRKKKEAPANPTGTGGWFGLACCAAPRKPKK